MLIGHDHFWRSVGCDPDPTITPASATGTFTFDAAGSLRSSGPANDVKEKLELERLKTRTLDAVDPDGFVESSGSWKCDLSMSFSRLKPLARGTVMSTRSPKHCEGGTS